VNGQPSAISFQLSAISFQRSAFGHQLLACWEENWYPTVGLREDNATMPVIVRPAAEN
jgi:hypothetical protein